MKNKRRSKTQTAYEGTETGSVTYTVTFFPDVFDGDRLIVEYLDTMAKAKRSSAWIHDACIGYWDGTSVPPMQVRRVEKQEKPKENIYVETHSSVAQNAAEGMGLKFGKRK